MTTFEKIYGNKETPATTTVIPTVRMYFFEGNEELRSLISTADHHQHSGSCGRQPRAPQAEDRRRASPADTATVSRLLQASSASNGNCPNIFSGLLAMLCILAALARVEETISSPIVWGRSSSDTNNYNIRKAHPQHKAAQPPTTRTQRRPKQEGRETACSAVLERKPGGSGRRRGRRRGRRDSRTRVMFCVMVRPWKAGNYLRNR